MPQAPTARLGLYRSLADGSENVSVVLDILNNLDKLDTQVGRLACTSGTRPGTPFNGQMIRETDTGKYYTHNGTTWIQDLVGTADFDLSITMPGDTQQLKMGGSTSSAMLALKRTLAGSSIFSTRVGAETNSRLVMNADGLMSWGDGTASGDTNLYRSAANTLKTDDSLIVGVDLNVTGNGVIGGNVTADQAILNGATHRPQLSSQTTVANTTSETNFCIFNIPANDAVAGAVYRIKAWGIASVAAATTPTLRFRSNIGATTLTSFSSAITCRSGMTDGMWEAELLVVCVTAGAAATWRPMLRASHNFVTSNQTFGSTVPDVPSAVTKDSTVSNNLAISATWSAASASNTLTCLGFIGERVA